MSCRRTRLQKLDAELAQLETQTGHQLVVATVPDLQGYEIEDYGYQLGRTWALGKKGVNDGVILLVAPKERKVRIEVGYGLEPVLTDALTSVILQTKVLPQFKQGRMEQGIVDGAEAIIQQLALPADQAQAVAQQAAAQPRAHQRGPSGVHIPVFFIILIVFWVLFGVLRGGRGGRGGGMWWLLPLLLSSSIGAAGTAGAVAAASAVAAAAAVVLAAAAARSAAAAHRGAGDADADTHGPDGHRGRGADGRDPHDGRDLLRGRRGELGLRRDAARLGRRRGAAGSGDPADRRQSM